MHSMWQHMMEWDGPIEELRLTSLGLEDDNNAYIYFERGFWRNSIDGKKIRKIEGWFWRPEFYPYDGPLRDEDAIEDERYTGNR